jgi:CRP-like cAMP-binding protein
MNTGRTKPSKQNRLLAALLPADFSLLTTDLKEVPLSRGTMLHEEGQLVSHVYFPHSGMISLLAVMPEGDAIETATVGREGVVGATSGKGPPRAFSRAVVQVAGIASRITVPRFQIAVGRSDGITNLVTRYHEALMAQVQQSAACNAIHQVEARLCRWLLQVRDRVDSDTLPLTQEFLSQMLGVRRTTVTAVAGALQATGLIRYHRRGQIDILDRKGLEEAACGCYEIVRQQMDPFVPKDEVPSDAAD